MQLKFKKSTVVEVPKRKNKAPEHKLELEDNDSMFPDVKVKLTLESESQEALDKLLKKELDKPVEMTLENL